MRKLLALTLIAGTLLASCSKKSTPTPSRSNTVTITGIAYSTVKIGTQTWTTVNYNGTGGVNYNNSATNVVTYGKLYTLAEAQSIVLPTGWHLPTQSDVSTLLTYVGATGVSNIGIDGDSTVAIKLKSKTGWTFTEGNNSSGFNAFPAGVMNNGSFSNIAVIATFWTNTADAYSDQYILDISNVQDGPNVDNDAGLDYVPTTSVSTFSASIRFVRDN